MKYLILFLIIFTPALFAEEISLGMVYAAEGDSLILADGLKVHVPYLSQGKYVSETDKELNLDNVQFPFTASIVTPDQDMLPEKAKQLVYVKIHKFYHEVEGRLVQTSSTK
ncbi:hypothetical protein A2Y85_00900 [candidate division WOR-3 bacterium RBG_13_43_14]|uniref:Uncharacterized protein n=1 Tax=candidate division WOR-3 bacterium RBG_13_43_14 TaxID=1802590 RepID=A0A1F4UD20_UNCW3|nr:MAG: hypothetical protein A2Y85_00900 [candidate division WOR-3 bacterium RBG_13_43_14]